MSAAPELQFPPVPHSEDAEQAVLSALMQDASMVPLVQRTLAAADFYNPVNGAIYAAILSLVAHKAPTDPLAVSHELEQRGDLERVGGKDYVGYLSDAIPTAANVEYHAGIVIEHAKRRAGIDAFSRHADLLREGKRSVADVVGGIRPALDSLTIAAPGQRFELLTPAQLADIPQARPLVEHLLSVGGFSSVVAPYSSYKSFVALDLSLCIAKGLDFHGYAVTQGPTVYQAGEGAAGLHKRLEAWRTLNGLPDIGAIRFLPKTLKLNTERDLADFLAVLRGLSDRPVLVTIDTFARSIRGNENGAEDTGLYVEAVDRIREEIGAHVQIVHHTGWEGTRSRGSSNIPASLDTELSLDRDDDRVTLTVTKQKDDGEIAPLTLEAVPIAGSLAFRRVAVNSSELSQTERTALESLPADGAIASKDWLTQTGAKERTFYRAQKRLESLAYAKKTRAGWTRTDAGSAAL